MLTVLHQIYSKVTQTLHRFGGNNRGVLFRDFGTASFHSVRAQSAVLIR